MVVAEVVVVVIVTAQSQVTNLLSIWNVIIIIDKTNDVGLSANFMM